LLENQCGLSEQANKGRDLSQVIIHQRNVCRFNGASRTSGGHGKADLGFDRAGASFG
jgi:hypothetical protein